MSEQLPEEECDEFTCAACKGTFGKGWTDEEAMAEKGKLFPLAPVEDCCLVCDDCFKAMGYE